MIAPLAAKPDAILIVAMDNLGDLVFTSALPPALRRTFPDVAIDVWCKRYTADVAHLMPHVRHVIAADPPWAVHPQRARPSKLAFLRSLAAVRRGNYDVALLTGSPWRLAAAVRATGIPVRIGGRRSHNTPFLTEILPPDDPEVPVVIDQARLLRPLGVTLTQTHYALDVQRLGARRAGIAARLPDWFVVLHPFAAVRRKRMPLSRWIDVARRLAARHVPVLWCGTSAELAELRASDHPEALYVDDLGADSLAVTAAALSLAGLFIGHDSGPLHVAASLGVPVIDVFVGGNPARYGPQGPGPSLVLSTTNPEGIDAGEILGAVDALGLFSPT